MAKDSYAGPDGLSGSVTARIGEGGQLHVHFTRYGVWDGYPSRALYDRTKVNAYGGIMANLIHSLCGTRQLNFVKCELTTGLGQATEEGHKLEACQTVVHIFHGPQEPQLNKFSFFLQMN